MFTMADNRASTQCHKRPWWCPHALCPPLADSKTLRNDIYIVEVTKRPLAGPASLLPHNHRPLSTHGPLGDIPPLPRRRLLSMVRLSTTTCTPKRPRRRLRPLLLRDMRFSLRGYLPWKSMKIWRGFSTCGQKKYMWSIHKCDHNSLGHCKSKWAWPIRILHSRNLPTYPLDSHPVCHAYMQILAKLSHHSRQTSPHSLPPTRLLFIPRSSRHAAMNASHLWMRKHSHGTLQPNLSLPVCLVIVQCALCYRLCLNAGQHVG